MGAAKGELNSARPPPEWEKRDKTCIGRDPQRLAQLIEAHFIEECVLNKDLGVTKTRTRGVGSVSRRRQQGIREHGGVSPGREVFCQPRPPQVESALGGAPLPEALP